MPLLEPAAKRIMPHFADERALRHLTKRCRTVEALACADLETEARECALDASGLHELRTSVCAAHAPRAESALAIHARELACVDALVTTGLAELDWLLGGGLAAGEVTELIGRPGAGKSQLCMLACAAQAAAGDSAGGCALFVQTCASGFSAERTYAMLRAAQPGLSRAHSKARLDERLRVIGAPRLPELLRALDELNGQLRGLGEAAAGAAGSGAAGEAGAEHPRSWLGGLRLVVVDSAYAALSSEYRSASSSAGGAQLARLQRLLREIAARHRIAVLVTNACLSPAGGGGPAGRDEVAAALGHAWSHTAHTRLVVHGGGGAPGGARQIRLAKRSFSPRPVRADGAAVSFTVTSDGQGVEARRVEAQ